MSEMSSVSGPKLSDAEFDRFRDFIFQAAGIHLSAGKKSMVQGRLAKRVAAHGLPSFAAYHALVASGEGGEAQAAIDLLTTNETYFFREPRHFDLLRTLAKQAPLDRPLRVWSAACSSGEEPYSIAMVLAQQRGAGAWQVLGTDISSRMLARARQALYPLSRCQHIPPDFLKQYCLKGQGAHEGHLRVHRPLREAVQWQQLNLQEGLANAQPFDIIFLRNVMIYFDLATKRHVVDLLLQRLKPGGHLLVGHSETLNDVSTAVKTVAPAVYRKPGGS